jgi:hypothetical protein
MEEKTEPGLELVCERGADVDTGRLTAVVTVVVVVVVVVVVPPLDVQASEVA